MSGLQGFDGKAQERIKRDRENLAAITSEEKGSERQSLRALRVERGPPGFEG
jgi:hypothetical protein